MALFKKKKVILDSVSSQEIPQMTEEEEQNLEAEEVQIVEEGGL